MTDPIVTEPVLIIGAGIAGLTAARRLHLSQCPYLVLDKARGVGGRMATRRFGGGRFDHGAQYFSVRDSRFSQWVSEWQTAGVVAEWGQGFPNSFGAPSGDGHPRYRGIDGMTAVPKYLARQLRVRLETPVTAVAREDRSWIVHTRSGERISGRALLLTPPVPQSRALLDASQVAVPPAVRQELERLKYNPCLALMALLAGPSRLPKPGGLRISDGPIAWIADNHQKGISPDGYGVTIHASAEYSRQHWRTDAAVVARELLEVAANWHGQESVEWQLHHWRYSQPAGTYPDQMLCLPGTPALALAGDAFGGPRVEGAAISGDLAAAALLEQLDAGT